MKIAFVCDWLTGMQGGKRCLKAACELWPQAVTCQKIITRTTAAKIKVDIEQKI